MVEFFQKGDNRGAMSYFSDFMTEHLKKHGMTKYRLSKESGVSESLVINVVNGKRRPTDEVIQRFASVEALGLSEATLKTWRVVDEIDPEVVLHAAQIVLSKRS